MLKISVSATGYFLSPQQSKAPFSCRQACSDRAELLSAEQCPALQCPWGSPAHFGTGCSCPATHQGVLNTRRNGREERDQKLKQENVSEEHLPLWKSLRDLSNPVVVNLQSQTPEWNEAFLNLIPHSLSDRNRRIRNSILAQDFLAICSFICFKLLG